MCYMYEQIRTMFNANCENLFVGVEDRTFYVFIKFIHLNLFAKDFSHKTTN